MENFEQELTNLINAYSKESSSDTPDFILAHYLASCLDIFNFALIQRTKWYHYSQPLQPKQYSFFKSYNNF